MLVVSVSAEFLFTFAYKVALITVDEVVTGLVPGELTGRLDLLVTNITRNQLLHLPRVNILDVRWNMTDSLLTFPAVEHFLEVDSHVL